jgi:hypothetical protein
MATERQLSVLFACYPYGGNGNTSSTHPDICDWLLKTVPIAKADPRVSQVATANFSDTPITMTRNLSVKAARDAGYDVLVMIDSDQKPDCLLGKDPDARPFWNEAFNFIYDNYDKGPQVVGAPYCGAPPVENIFVFKWASLEADGFPDESTIKLEQYAREEAHMMSGIQECAALPTGLIMFDMRAFELTEPQPKAEVETVITALEAHCEIVDGKLVGPDVKTIVERIINEKTKAEHSWFYYEYTDIYECEKASTEDVTATRDISLYGLASLGYNPIHCAWSSWAGHWKPKCVTKPSLITASDINDRYARAHKAGHNRRLQHVDAETAIARARIPAPNGQAK